MPESSAKLDAADSMFLATELEYIKSRVWEKKIPPFAAFQLFPVTSEADEGADTIVWEEIEMIGVAKIVANDGDDLPMVDAFMTENKSSVRTIGDGYRITNQDVRRARKAGKNLSARKAMAARRAHDQTMNTIAFNGSKKDDIKGIFDTPNANIVVAIAAAAAPNGIAWTAASGKTPEEIIQDMFALVDTPNEVTNGVEKPNTLVLPIAAYNYISATQKSTASDTTILEFFQRVRKGVTVVSATEFDAVTNPPSGAAGPLSVAMAFVRDEEHLSLEIPMPFRQNAPQPRNLVNVIPCESRFGGVIVYLPLAIAFMEGI